jgi:hypothetical protein
MLEAARDGVVQRQRKHAADGPFRRHASPIGAAIDLRLCDRQRRGGLDNAPALLHLEGAGRRNQHDERERGEQQPKRTRPPVADTYLQHKLTPLRDGGKLGPRQQAKSLFSGYVVLDARTPESIQKTEAFPRYLL